MPGPTLPDDFEKHARAVLAHEPELFGQLLSLREHVQSLAAHPMPSLAPPPPAMLNSRNQHLLDEAMRLLGPEKFEQVFGFPAGEKINLVDPSMFGTDT